MKKSKKANKKISKFSPDSKRVKKAGSMKNHSIRNVKVEDIRLAKDFGITVKKLISLKESALETPKKQSKTGKRKNK